MSIENGINSAVENLAPPPAATISQLTTNPFPPVASQGGVPADTVDGSYKKELDLGKEKLKDHYGAGKKVTLSGVMATSATGIITLLVQESSKFFHNPSTIMAILAGLLICATVAAVGYAGYCLYSALQRKKADDETEKGLETQYKANSNVRNQIIKSDTNVKIQDKQTQELANNVANRTKAHIMALSAKDQYTQYATTSLKMQENYVDAVKNFESKRAGAGMLNLDHVATPQIGKPI